MMIDAHQHFWVYDARGYDWINESMTGLRRDFMPADLAREQVMAGLDGAVTVQARSMVEETRWLLELSERESIIKGVVGWVDLCSPEVTDQLDEFASHPKLVGIRHVVHDEPDDEFMLRTDFLQGIKKLSDYDLTYDLLLFPKHLPVAVEVVKSNPYIKFVLDHLGKPIIKDGVVSPWDDDLRRLAAFENVTCKLSGMVTEADWEDWKPDDFMPYLDIVLDAFEPNRLMIGSDWPVCTLAGNYAEVLSIVIDYVTRLSTHEQEMILGGTCSEFYRLPTT